MRVLFVVPYAPSRLRVRPNGFVRHLARQHDVHVLALDTVGLSSDSLMDIDQLRREGIPVTVIQEPHYRPYLRVLRSTLAPHGTVVPLQVAYTASPALRAAITLELRARSYDVIHVEHVRGLGSLPTEPGVPVVWDAVDCVSLLYEQSAKHGATLLVHMVGLMESQRLRTFERWQLKHLRQVLVTSERDRQALLKVAEVDDDKGVALTHAEITVLPHGIDPRHFRALSVERQPNMLIFAGKMDYHANVAGALLLADRIMPLIWRQRPDVHLTIAGSNPSRAVRQLERDQRITVTGYVRDLNALVGSAYIALSPLPYAVGIQNKILEAMASGTPVVASASSAEGLQAVPGRDVLVGSTSEEFASATLRLLDDAESWRNIADHGVTYVATHHHWGTIAEQLTTVYERAREVQSATAYHERARQPQTAESRDAGFEIAHASVHSKAIS